MPSTYTTNNGIELIATGEQSGTWGDTTNTNLSLIDASLDGQVTITLASAGTSGSPNTLPVSDGSASNGRNRLVIFNDGGDLGATAYVQLTPNDAEKIVYIRNSLSGSRSILLFQGTYSASNDYEVPAGTTAVVYFNGGGSGAVAANVFNNAYFDSLRLGSVSVTAILDEDNMASDSATALATQQSIKAYVDSQVGTVDTLAEILANGNTTGGTDIAVSAGDDITFADNSKAIFGAGSDLQIYHDGSNSRIQDTGTGNLLLYGRDVTLADYNTTEPFITCVNNNAVTLYYDNAAKLATTSTGATVTGTLVSNGLTVDTDTLYVDSTNNRVGIGTTSPGSSLQISQSDPRIRIIDTDTAGTFELRNTSNVAYISNLANADMLLATNSLERMRITSAGNVGIGTTAPATTLDVNGTVTANGLSLGDNEKAQFGASNDLQIYHDGSNSIIADANGTGNLILYARDLTLADYNTGESFITCVNNNAVTLYYDNSAKLATSATGVTVTGTVTADGLTVSSDSSYAIDVSRPSNGNTVLRITSGSTAGNDAIFRADIANTTGSSGVYFGDTDTNGIGRIMYEHTGDYMRFYTSSAERMRIDSSGNVGIGTTSTSNAGLSVVSAKTFSTAFVKCSDTTGAAGVFVQNDNNTGDCFMYAFNSAGTPDAAVGTSKAQSLKLYTNNSARVTVDSTGKVGIGTTSPSTELHVIGTITGTSKNFLIDHPTKQGMKLRHGSLEGAENGVYVRGKTTSNIIELPDYWIGLVHEESITVNLTAIGSSQNLFVEKIENNKIYVAGADAINCFYTVFGERKDIDRLEVEFVE